jgi:uncharacterized protein YodC (DUF2158 family)
METNFKVGDTVRLKTGGAEMVITQIIPSEGVDNLNIVCIYFDGVNLKTIVFLSIFLVKA